MAGQNKQRKFYWLTGLLLLVFAIGVLKLASHFRQQKNGHFDGDYLSLCYERDSVLGYAPKKDTIIHSIKVNGKDTVYDIVYRIGKDGLRRTEACKGKDYYEHILFFGCSFTYGEGLPGDSTMPALFACNNSDFGVFNHGYSGYGPQQMLATIQRGINYLIPDFKGVAIYALLPEHVYRAVGTMRVHNQWGAHMPYYALENDSLARKGDFTSGRPITAAWYRLLGTTGISSLLPDPKITLKDIDLTVRIIAESKRLYLQQFPDSKIYVLMYPESSMKDVGEQLVTALKNKGIEVLDYRGLFEMDSLHTIIGDGHPNGLANKIIVDQLSKDIGRPQSKMEFDPLIK